MPPSKDILRTNILKSIEYDYLRDLKSHAGRIDEEMVTYRRRRCKRFGHILRKDIQCFTDTPDEGRWFIECCLDHPGDSQGSGSVSLYISKPIDPRVLQEIRDKMLARQLQAQQLLPAVAHSRGAIFPLIANVLGPTRTPRARVLVRSSARPYSVNYPSRPGSVSSGFPVVNHDHGFNKPPPATRAALGTPCIEILDSDSEDSAQQQTRRRLSRSPSIEVINDTPDLSKRFTIWLFFEQLKPPAVIYLNPLPGADIIAFRDYDKQWERRSLKIATRVKVLAASNNGEHLWQFGRLCDMRVPVSARAIVVAEVGVDRFHRRIKALVKHAFTGSFPSYSK